MIRIIKNKCGFTLIEIVTALGISSVIIAVLYTVVIMTLNQWNRIEVSNELRHNARYAMTMLLWDIRNSDKVEVWDSSDPVQPNTLIILKGNNSFKYYLRDKSQNPDRIGKLFKNTNQVCWYVEEFNLKRDIDNPYLLRISMIFEIEGKDFLLSTAVNLEYK